MPVYCPSCDAVVPAADIELSTRLAKCQKCNEVFPLDLPAAPAAAAMPPVPVGVSVFDDGLTRRLSYRWFTPVAFFLLFFCIAWDGFLVFWYTMALGFGRDAGGFQWLAVVFPVAHVAVGLGLTYLTLCLFVNRTVVSVGLRVRVQHGPLFWPGQVSLPAEDVTAVYCEEAVSHGKRGVRYSYTVKAVTADGRSVPLLANMDSLPRAKFFELKLEEWLGLPPTAVPGEAT